MLSSVTRLPTFWVKSKVKILSSRYIVHILIVQLLLETFTVATIDANRGGVRWGGGGG
jgi:hypothetical protein